MECVLLPLTAFWESNRKASEHLAPSGNHPRWQKALQALPCKPTPCHLASGAVTKLLVMSFLINGPRGQLLVVEHHWHRSLFEG